MDFLIRNLEALGDEVAAALDDLADEVTGRNKAGRGDDDEDYDDDARASASGDEHDPRNRSAMSDGGRPWGASDGGGSDTASCNSAAGDTDMDAVRPSVVRGAPAAPRSMSEPPRPDRGGDNGGGPRRGECLAPVKAPSPGLRRRKPLLGGTKVSTPAPAGGTATVAMAAPPSPARQGSPAAAPAAAAAPALSAQETADHATESAPEVAVAAPAAAPAAVNPTPAQPAAHATHSIAIQADSPGCSPTTGAAPAAAKRPAPPASFAPAPQPASNASSGFDLCDRDDRDDAVPVEEGEYLVL